MEQNNQYNQGNNNYNNQENYNQNSYDSDSYNYSGSYNQSAEFTKDLKGHQYDGLISIITGIISLFFFGLIGIVLGIISLIFGISARKIPEQKTYGTVGLVCGIITLIKVALTGLITMGIIFPFLGSMLSAVMYNF